MQRPLFVSNQTSNLIVIRYYYRFRCYLRIYLFIRYLFFFCVDPSPLYDNNYYHEECLRCNSCGLNLTGPNQKRARRFKNQILCDLHFADVALMECSDFMQQLRSFKPQSLGCAVARRKSSTTLIFPLPPQACSGKLCTVPCTSPHICTEICTYM